MSDLPLDLLLEDALTESESGEEGRQAATQLSKQELIRQVHLRRHINQLKKILEEKDIKAEDCRYMYNSLCKPVSCICLQPSCKKKYCITQLQTIILPSKS